MDFIVLLVLFVIGVFNPKAGKSAYELDTLNHFLNAKETKSITTTSSNPVNTKPPTPATTPSVASKAPQNAPSQQPSFNDVLNTSFETDAFNQF